MMMMMTKIMPMMMMMMIKTKIMPISLPGEGADAAVQAVVLLIDGARLHTARDLLPLLLPLLLVNHVGVLLLLVNPEDLEQLVVLHVVDQLLLHPGGVLAITTEHPARVLVPIMSHDHVLLQRVRTLADKLAGITRIPQHRLDLLILAFAVRSLPRSHRQESWTRTSGTFCRLATVNSGINNDLFLWGCPH